MVANRFLYEIDVWYGREIINFDARRFNRSIVKRLLTVWSAPLDYCKLVGFER
jgi:hypothetical protein